MLGERCKDGCSPLASTCHLPSGTIRRSKPLSGHALGGLRPCEELKYAKMILFPMVSLNHGKTPWRGMGFKEIRFKASKNKYLRHQFKKKNKGSKRILFFPALVRCFGPFMQFSILVVFESPGPSVLSLLGPSALWWLWCLKTFWR